MRQTIKNKITTLKTIAKNSTTNSGAKSGSVANNDNLSKAIRNEKDAVVFRKELANAFRLAKE